MDLTSADQNQQDGAPTASPEDDRWRITQGPFGHGACLVTTAGGDGLRLLVPPGVPLQSPEPTVTLLRWREAKWCQARLAGTPRVIELLDAVQLAGDHCGWALETSRKREAWLDAAGIPVRERVEEVMAQLLDPESGLDFDIRFVWERSPTDETESASHFSQLLGAGDERDLVRQIRDLADGAETFEEFRTCVRDAREKAGDERVRDSVVALLHARARSRSWRATNWAGPVVPESVPLASIIAQRVDCARTGRDAMRQALRFDSGHPEFEYVLLQLLYTRAHSRRWCWTAPVRRVFARPELRPVRRVVHSAIHDRHAYRSGDLEAREPLFDDRNEDPYFEPPVLRSESLVARESSY
jgi:hypothetical protein